MRNEHELAGTVPPSDPGAMLMVDDDVELCVLMTEFLAAHGFRLTAAHDGTSGLNLALKGGWDLVILDVMLPVHRRIRNLRGRCAVEQWCRSSC